MCIRDRLRQMDLMGVTALNGWEAMEISKDKFYTHQILSSVGVPIPRNVLGHLPPQEALCEDQLLSKFSAHLSFPMIVKCLSGSMGQAVWKVDSPADLIRQAPEIRGVAGEHAIVFQEYVATSCGRDLRIIVANGKILSAILRTAKTGFKANFHQGGRVKHVEISPELAEMAIKVARVAKLDIAGVDVLMDSDNDKYLICEVNSSPGFEGMERATRVNVAKELLTAVWDKIVFSLSLIHISEPTRPY
eukprot:TRINITY_DN4187_c0_g1_i1.p1 TRINITY_DN4187_c0_g1~~TRINITY_DN4187_c0_g1_i1.p1  ORF type:complete len:247 (-),score=82.71 TRINITY_DN4187_c0_g1_i1:61-801(-)